MTVMAGDSEHPRAFSELLTELDYPMYIVTTAADGERAGCLVGFASQTSITPPRFTVWLSDLNRTAEVAARASTLVVHFLRDGDRHLAALFGGETGDETDKFALVPSEDGPDGVPVLSQCDWFAGRIVDRVENDGDHTGYLLEPFAADRRHAGLPNLGYQHVRDVTAGHEPDELGQAV
jgi:flavin reductase (DIM6/NTAB) family NADH-FMN oxidoreductase RutF